MKAEYTKDNTTPFTVAEMTGLFRNHEIVTFTIPGVGETCAESALFRDALEELQRLAAKGLRAEQAIKAITGAIELHKAAKFGCDKPKDALSIQGQLDGLEMALDRLKGVE